MNLDIDTVVCERSLAQARRAAKAVCAAVDALAKTEASGEVRVRVKCNAQGYRNAFCCVRPPGHHIGTNGAVNNPNNANVSQGFCLFNNVAIGAAYARATYPAFSRVAIVDLDVHHGNGTEDCVQHMCPCEKATTTAVDCMELSVKNYQFKPWRDETDGENVFFASIHGYGRLANSSDYFYPGSGQERNKVNFVSDAVLGDSFKVSVSRASEQKKPEIVDAFLTKQQGENAFYWRESLRVNVLPKLLAFKPDLIFISAGGRSGGV